MSSFCYTQDQHAITKSCGLGYVMSMYSYLEVEGNNFHLGETEFIYLVLRISCGETQPLV